MNKIIIRIDATALAKSGCILNLLRTVVGDVEEGKATGGYTAKATPARMVYGVGGHKFFERMFMKERFPVAMKEAIALYEAIPKEPEVKKTFFNDSQHLRSVLFNVWTEFVEKESTFEILEVDSKACVECTFEIPYYEDDYVKIYLCGTIDKIGKFKGGCFAIGDWKFTSAWATPEYFVQYELSRQLRIYNLAVKLQQYIAPDSILGRIGATQIGVFIDGIFVSSKPNDTKVIRSSVFQINQQQMDEFQLTLDDMCQKIGKAIQTGYIPKEGILNGSCDGKWSRCSFWNICKSPDQVGKVLLKRDFRQREYNPLKFNKE